MIMMTRGPRQIHFVERGVCVCTPAMAGMRVICIVDVHGPPTPLWTPLRETEVGELASETATRVVPSLLLEDDGAVHVDAPILALLDLDVPARCPRLVLENLFSGPERPDAADVDARERRQDFHTGKTVELEGF